jgi:hypothetical protein
MTAMVCDPIGLSNLFNSRMHTHKQLAYTVICASLACASWQYGKRAILNAELLGLFLR